MSIFCLFKLGILFLLCNISVSSANEGAPSGGDSKSHVEGHNEEVTDPDTFVLALRDTPKDFKIPTELWELILEKDNRKEKDEPLIVWLPLKIFLSAKASGILVHEKIQYNLPRGGGTIDVSRNTSGDRGTFYLKFGLNEFTNQAGMKVFFLSNAKKRKLDDDVYGAGCNVFFDISKALLNAQGGQGLKFNITDNRHISALSGHFIFVQQDKDKVFLSQVEFTDSKNREYLCKI